MKKKTTAERNVCPKCKKIPSLMAGINVPKGDLKSSYLVCWKDYMYVRIAKGEKWISFKEAPTDVLDLSAAKVKQKNRRAPTWVKNRR